jgi:uncharacterized protein (TIGR02246 family)
MENNKTVLQKANEAIKTGDNEGFLSYCTDDTEWTFVGERTLKGKEAVRQYMATTYLEPPEFEVDTFIAEGNFVVAVGTIRLKDEEGEELSYRYADVWRFNDGKMAELRAFVVKV